MSPPASETPSLRELRMGMYLPRGTPRFGPLTQQQLAVLTSTTQPHISGIEKGKHRASEFLLARLAQLYGVDRELMRAAQAETLRRLRLGLPQIK